MIIGGKEALSVDMTSAVLREDNDHFTTNIPARRLLQAAPHTPDREWVAWRGRVRAG